MSLKGSKTGGYQLEPLQFAVIMANVQYIRVKNSKKRSKQASQKKLHKLSDKLMYCENKPYALELTQSFHFKALPAARRQCVAIIYIDPKPCKKWEHHMEELLLRSNISNTLIPGWIMEPIFDHRLQQSLHVSDRGFQFFVHLRRYYNLSKTPTRPYVRDILRLIERFWMCIQVPCMLKIVTPTKLVFPFQRSKYPINRYLITHAYIVAHPNFALPTYWKDLKQIYTLTNTESPLLNEFTPNFIETMQQLEHYRFRFEGATWLTSNSAESDEIDFVPGYLTEYATPKHSIQRILLSVLSPNSTFVYPSTFYHNDITLFVPCFEIYRMEIPVAFLFESNKESGLYFVTCAPIRKIGWLSFTGYISAFDYYVWSILLICSLASGIVITLLDRYYSRNEKTKSKKFKSIFIDIASNMYFVMEVLLCQGTKVIHEHRILCGGWILVGIVLSNLYQGKNIEDLASPLPTSGLETLEQLIENKLVLYSSNIDDTFNFQLELDGASDFSDVSKEWGLQTKIEALLLRKNETLARSMAPLIHKPENHQEFLDYIKPGFFFKTVSRCGNDAYVDEYSKVIDIYHHLKMHLKRMYSSTETMGYLAMSPKSLADSYNVWYFNNVPWPPTIFTKRVCSLFQSGIIELWRSWSSRIETWNGTGLNARNPEPSFKSLNLDGNFVGVFYTYGVALVVICVGFICRNFKLLYKEVRSGVLWAIHVVVGTIKQLGPQLLRLTSVCNVRKDRKFRVNRVCLKEIVKNVDCTSCFQPCNP
ncbi:unnamed protein product [Orchesella dallaii]|uniref:Ionotropic glutamate receptor C-terminal domain-containing protein n=1 Tax=Orchesella dallaii TaxID=48710 RepID=A0ABP1Q0Y6_9HEXA